MSGTPPWITMLFEDAALTLEQRNTVRQLLQEDALEAAGYNPAHAAALLATAVIATLLNHFEGSSSADLAQHIAEYVVTSVRNRADAGSSS